MTASDGGVWRTMPNGVKVFIKDGQSLSEAISAKDAMIAAHKKKYKSKEEMTKEEYQEEARNFDGDRIVKMTIEREMPNGEMVTVEAGRSYNRAVREWEEKKAEEILGLSAEQLAEKGEFRTLSGKTVFIEKGQTLNDALKDNGKFSAATRTNTFVEKADGDYYKEPELPEFELVDTTDATNTFVNTIASGHGRGSNSREYVNWFADANMESKMKLVEMIDVSPRVREAGLSTMYHQHKALWADNNSEVLPFKEWLDTPMELYRGTSDNKTRATDTNVVLSYTQDIDMAAFFTSYNQGSSPQIEIIKVKPKHVLGTFNNDGENEVFVRQVYDEKAAIQRELRRLEKINGPYKKGG